MKGNINSIQEAQNQNEMAIESEKTSGSGIFKNEDESGEDQDRVASLHPIPRVTTRTKGYSDITGMVLQAPYNAKMMPYSARMEELAALEKAVAGEQGKGGSGRRKANSDIAAMMAVTFLPDDVKTASDGHHRIRQVSSSDVIKKFGYAPNLGYEDLK